MVFITGVRTDIDKTFHDLESPKFPLYVRTYLKSFGKSSKTCSYELRHDGSDALYVSCDVTDVLISKTSRKPVKYPDWWIDKYSPHVENRQTVLPEMHIPGGDPFMTKVTVSHCDTDTHRHTNWASYIKFCSDNIHAREMQYDKTYIPVTDGIRSFDIKYTAESALADELSVTSVYSRSQEDTYCLTVNKGGVLCAFSNFCFYNENESDDE